MRASRERSEGGRKPKLTTAVQKTVIETLRVGATFEAAAGRAGVSVEAIHEWRRRGAGKHSRPSTPLYAQFALAIDLALADAETGLVTVIRVASAKKWTAAAFLLERRWPDRYGRKTRIEHSGEVGAGVDPIPTRDIPDGDLETLIGILGKAKEKALKPGGDDEG